MLMTHNENDIFIDWITNDKSVSYLENIYDVKNRDLNRLTLDYIFTEYDEVKQDYISNFKKDFADIWESNNVNDC